MALYLKSIQKSLTRSLRNPDSYITPINSLTKTAQKSVDLKQQWSKSIFADQVILMDSEDIQIGYNKTNYVFYICLPKFNDGRL